MADIIGYIFIGVALVALILGIISGFIKTLLGLVSSIGSLAISAVLTPAVCKWELTQNLIEDVPIVINGAEVFFLRSAIVYCALSILFFVVCLVLQGIFTWLFNRVKLFKTIDKVLGLAINAVAVWAIFGIVFAFSTTSTDWLAAIDEQLLAQSGVNLGLAQFVSGIFQHINQSPILNSVYLSFNPIGTFIVSLIF